VAATLIANGPWACEYTSVFLCVFISRERNSADMYAFTLDDTGTTGSGRYEFCENAREEFEACVSEILFSSMLNGSNATMSSSD